MVMADTQANCFVTSQEDKAVDAVAAIDGELSLFDDWMERYQYIIELGRKLPTFPQEWQNDAHRVPGCQSQVWLEVKEEEGKLFFSGASDAAIVQGLVALLLRVYSGRTRDEILDTDPAFLHELGLVKALSANRGNGVEAMVQAIRNCAAA